MSEGIDHPEGEALFAFGVSVTGHSNPSKDGCAFRYSNYTSREVYCIFPS